MHSKTISLSLFAILFLFFSVSLFANDQVVYLRDGKTLTGEIVSQTATKIVLKLPDGSMKEIQKLDIKRVAFKGAPVKPQDPIKETPPGPDPAIAEQQKKEEEAKKQAIKDEKAEKRKKEIEEAKRNRLEVFLGAGSGTLEFQSPAFYTNAISMGSTLSSENGQWEIPLTGKAESGSAYRGELRYSWNRFVAQVGGSSIRSSSSYTKIGQNNLAGSLVGELITGPYQQSMKHGYGNLSFSVYPHPRFDIRPMIGLHRIWLKTEDASVGVGSEAYAGIQPFSVADQFKGSSFGIQYDMKLGSNFEIRSSLEFVNLKGNGEYQQNMYAYSSTLAQTVDDGFGLKNKWTAKGAILDLKFIYNWKYGVNFWMGINSLNIRYTIGDGNVTFQGGNGQNLEDSIQARILISNILGPVFQKETQASSILFGASYAYDFGSK